MFLTLKFRNVDWMEQTRASYQIKIAVLGHTNKWLNKKRKRTIYNLKAYNPENCSRTNSHQEAKTTNQMVYMPQTKPICLWMKILSIWSQWNLFSHRKRSLLNHRCIAQVWRMLGKGIRMFRWPIRKVDRHPQFKCKMTHSLWRISMKSPQNNHHKAPFRLMIKLALSNKTIFTASTI